MRGALENSTRAKDYLIERLCGELRQKDELISALRSQQHAPEASAPPSNSSEEGDKPLKKDALEDSPIVPIDPICSTAQRAKRKATSQSDASMESDKKKKRMDFRWLGISGKTDPHHTIA